MLAFLNRNWLRILTLGAVTAAALTILYPIAIIAAVTTKLAASAAFTAFGTYAMPAAALTVAAAAAASVYVAGAVLGSVVNWGARKFFGKTDAAPVATKLAAPELAASAPATPVKTAAPAPVTPSATKLAAPELTASAPATPVKIAAPALVTPTAAILAAPELAAPVASADAGPTSKASNGGWFTPPRAHSPAPDKIVANDDHDDAGEDARRSDTPTFV